MLGLNILVVCCVIFASLIFANGSSIRRKRNTKIDIMEEAEDHCVHHCWAMYTPSDQVTTAEIKRMLYIVKTNQVPSNRARRQTADPPGETFSGTGKVFYDNCQNTKSLDQCFKDCAKGNPPSQLQRLAIAENSENEEYCLPNRGNTVSFAGYYYKLQCISNAISTDPRSGNCSYNKTISNVTALSFRHLPEDHDRSLVYYNDDKDQNMRECKRVCKNINNQYVCYKPILIDRCGQQGYDLYARITKIQVKSQLGQLREVGAIDSDIYECSNFKGLQKPLYENYE